MKILKLTLDYITPEYISEEAIEYYEDLSDALEEADDIAFSRVGYPLDCWKFIDFGDGNHLYVFYPNDEDRTCKFKMTTMWY